MWRHAAAALLIAGVLSACAPRGAPRPPALGSPTLPEIGDLLDTVRARRASIRGLRAVARIAYSTGDDSRKARQILVAERPDRLRLEMLSPFGTVFVLATQNGRLAAYAPDDRAVYRGSASPDNLARYMQVDLPVSTAIDLILGTPPIESGKREPVLSREDDLVKLWQEDGRRVYVTWFTDRLEPARYEQRDEEGRVLLRASYAAFREVASVRVPTEITVELPWSGQRVDIRLGDPEVNPVLADATFVLETPAGIREIALDQQTP